MASLGALTLSADARSYSIGDDQSEFVIGRDAAADLILTDPRCSRRHARVIRVAGRVTLEPLSDHANTLLNGRVVDGRVPLRHGDIIRVGGVDIRVATAEPIEAVDTVPLYHAPHEHDRSREAANPESPPPAGAIRLPSPDSALVIGRDRAVADAIIDHPLISRRHARLTRIGDGLTIEDLGSTNGVLLNAQRISGSAALRIGDRVALGPQTFVVDREGLSPTQGVEGEGITAHGIVLEVTVDGARRKLLDDVSLAIPPARFVAILGPSGCGKSTLIRVLSGRARMSSGSVAVGDLNLERDFETIKHSLAFVPQRETLLDELTLHDALRYTARLRLSADVTAADLDKAVTAALARVGMTEHATKQIAKLSGGQRKRAALANELIARPAIIFADEVTSGLDEGTDREIMRLFKALARDGVTIVCVTHSVSNVVECCDEIVVMAAGGRTAYHGPPEGALIHFGVGSLAEVYERIASLTPQAAVVRAPSAGFRSRATVQTDRRAPLAQLPALASRTARVTIANQRGLAFIGAQSIVVGLLFRLVFGAHELPPAMQPSFVFLFGIASFWFGCSNASKEIVKERALFRLERDINLRIPSYVFAKLIVQGAVGLLQVLLMFGTMVIAGVTIPHPGPLVGVNLVAVLVGVSLGLAVSAFSRKEEQAASLVPIALIPQLLLSTALVPRLSNVAVALAKGLVSAYWMYRALLDILAGSGSAIGEPALIFAAHGVIFVALACVILFVDQTNS